MLFLIGKVLELTGIDSFVKVILEVIRNEVFGLWAGYVELGCLSLNFAYIMVFCAQNCKDTEYVVVELLKILGAFINLLL
jgi:hypothetical protein